MLIHPRLRNGSPSGDVVHDEDKLVVMVAIDHFDIDSRLCHTTRDLAKLTRFILVQSLHENLSLTKDTDPRRFECPAGSDSVDKEEVSDTVAVDDEGSPSLHAHACAAQRLAHLSQRAGAVLKCDC